VPNLFVFPYDWRKSNIENAIQLKDYVDCVQQFYPGARVNMAAHSMGGLLARRYILQYSPNHHVQRLITLDSPWVGALSYSTYLRQGTLCLSLRQDRDKVCRRVDAGCARAMPSPNWFTRGGKPAAARDRSGLQQQRPDQRYFRQLR
jgi:alpha-beta hydrolase superfamily lysophospholipase